MSPSILKLAPQAVVLTAAIYWSWPAVRVYLPVGTPTVATDGKKDESPVFISAMLSPTFPSVPKRNPYLPYGATFSTMAKSGQPGAKKFAGAKSSPDAQEAGLVLGATCIVGNRRMASINGRIYREKEAVESADDESARFIVGEIGLHKVLLLSEGRVLQLKYGDGDGSSATKPSDAKSSGNPRRSAS